MTTREALMTAALTVFDEQGFDRATVASICRASGISNGSFFHAFASKEALGAGLFLDALSGYHAALLAVLPTGPSALAGVQQLVSAHLNWVVNQRPQARLLFEQSRADWLVHIRPQQRQSNDALRAGINAWRTPLVLAGDLAALPDLLFFSQVIGPAQLLCRAWLADREATDPRLFTQDLIDCAVRAVVTPQGEVMNRHAHIRSLPPAEGPASLEAVRQEAS